MGYTVDCEGSSGPLETLFGRLDVQDERAPSTSPERPTFNSKIEELEYRLMKKEILIRLHDRRSGSIRDEDGYKANHHDFRGFVCKKCWTEIYAFEKIRFGTGNVTSGMTFNMMNHISNGWRIHNNGDGGSSYFISTTEDLHWAIWEIARRLHDLVDNPEQVTMSIITRHESYPADYGGYESIFFDPLPFLYGLRPFTNNLDHEAFNMAINFARASSERLFYRRIFDEDIEEELTWTQDEPPFELYDFMYRPLKFCLPRSTWLDNLAWKHRGREPYYTPFKVAARVMECRKYEIKSGRG
ncbi:uncharacterized protein IL334_004706 [Kwoniella shivajii]|uniref:Uncharacterized protein n=1 Tax=Kwoniella shivajii TaxID=564305 RepID=A0ABZ1D136_9TREE|nr:hypothetical protein IL334_004706 [Kwoniella shivajii]